MEVVFYLLQIFPHHYHPHFTAGYAKTLGSKISKSFQLGVSNEEEEDGKLYGGLSPQQHKEQYVGSFAGSYAWLCRLENLKNTVQEFSPRDLKYLNFSQSSHLPEMPESVLKGSDGGMQSHAVVSAPKKLWYEEPPSSVMRGLTDHSSFSSHFISTLKNAGSSVTNATTRDSSRQCYESHCFLPATSQDNTKLVRVDITSGLVLAYYGQSNESSPESVMRVVEMAVYCTDLRSYFSVKYVRKLFAGSGRGCCISCL